MTAASLLTGVDVEKDLNEELAEICLDCELDPWQFVLRMFPWGVVGTPLEHEAPRTWQREVLEELRDAIQAGHKKVFIDIASGHGIGKSAEISWLVLWAMCCHHTRGVITANTKDQLSTKTMPELGKWHQMLFAREWIEYNALSVRRAGGGNDWRMDALPWTKDKPDSFGGLHNKNGIVLVVFDEASGIHRVIYETIDGAMSDADNLIIWVRFGNPLRNVGPFAETFRQAPPSVGYTIRKNIDSRTVEGTDIEFINSRIEINGGEDTDYAKSRWRGVFPSQSDWQLIDTAVVDRAMKLKEPRSILTDPIVMGIDFARAGQDMTVVRMRKGYDGRSFPTYRWDRDVGKDSMQLAAHIARVITHHKPHYVMADQGGIGGPIIDRLRQLGHDVLGVEPGGASGDKTRWKNKRAEIWCRFGDWLAEGGALPDERDLRQQILQQEFFFSGDRNQICLVSKEDMRDEGLHSPDEAEALIQTFGFEVGPLHDPRSAAGGWREQGADIDYDPFSRFGE